MFRLTSHPVSRWRPAFARAFHGLTGPRVAVGLLLVLLICTFSPVLVTHVRHGVPFGTVLIYLGLLFLAKATWTAAAVALGLLVYNLGHGWHRFVRLALAAFAVAAGCAARPATFWIDTAVYVGLTDRWTYIEVLWLPHIAFIGSMLGALILVTREQDLAHELAAEALREVEHDRAHKAARLQAAQAQIEPHFLFNALANVKRLYQLDRSAGRAMLRNLSQVLGSALGQMRDERCTLVREVGLSLAYLRVQEIRMGDRLKVETRVPEALHAARFPSMMLSTLVENAIKHGIAPLTDGGTVRIEAETAGGMLRVKVTDTGRGLVHGGGTGVGLANIEARLASEFGGDAQLTLEERPSGGTVAIIVIPLQPVDGVPSPDECVHA